MVYRCLLTDIAPYFGSCVFNSQGNCLSCSSYKPVKILSAPTINPYIHWLSLLPYHRHTKAWFSRISGKVFLYCISKHLVIYHLNLIIIHLDNSAFPPEGSLGNHISTHSHSNMVNPRWHFGTLTVFHLLVVITVSVLVDDILNLYQPTLYYLLEFFVAF